MSKKKSKGSDVLRSYGKSIFSSEDIQKALDDIERELSEYMEKLDKRDSTKVGKLLKILQDEQDERDLEDIKDIIRTMGLNPDI